MTTKRSGVLVLVQYRAALESATGILTPGAKVIRADCGHAAFVSPASVRMLATADSVTTVCNTCHFAAVADGRAPLVPSDLRVPPGARAEIAAAENGAELLAMLDRLNVREIGPNDV